MLETSHGRRFGERYSVIKDDDNYEKQRKRLRSKSRSPPVLNQSITFNTS